MGRVSNKIGLNTFHQEFKDSHNFLLFRRWRCLPGKLKYYFYYIQYYLCAIKLHSLKGSFCLLH